MWRHNAEGALVGVDVDDPGADSLYSIEQRDICLAFDYCLVSSLLVHTIQRFKIFFLIYVHT